MDSWLARQPRSADILDVGCATGFRAVAFARAGHRVLAIDYVDQALAIKERNAALSAEACGREILPVQFRQADLREPIGPALGRTFDLIHLRRVLNFLTLAQAAARLDDLVPALKPGGWLVASFIATGIADPATMTARAGLSPVPDQALYPGFYAHPFADLVREFERRGGTVIEAFSDWSVEAGLIVPWGP